MYNRSLPIKMAYEKKWGCLSFQGAPEDRQGMMAKGLSMIYQLKMLLTSTEMTG